MKQRIGILTACDSEKHLSEPVFDELAALGYDVNFIQLFQNNIPKSYQITDNILKHIKHSFILAVADRPEQVGGVLAAFHNKVPIGHLYAGDINSFAVTFDDTHRHAITLYCDIAFCSCEESAVNVRKLTNSVMIMKTRIYVTGSTHFDNTNIREIKLRNDYLNIVSSPYILILINSETKGNNQYLINQTIEKALSLGINYEIMIAKGNKDAADIETLIYVKLLNNKNMLSRVHKTPRLSHEQFLSLLANCSYFITNSSSAIYEAPALLAPDRIIQIGSRNKLRTRIPVKSNSLSASKNIADIISNYLENKT